jgi:protocatechuate 3,4-dioxygenase beta subunit
MTNRSQTPEVAETDSTGAAPNRRTVLRAGAAALGLGAVGGGLRGAVTLAQDGVESSPAATATACVLTPELTEGPYCVEDALIRRDITDGKPGVPLTLRIAVQDLATSCGPLANAAVEIWHCDARGYYSGVSANNPGPDADPTLVAEAAEQMFLRGVQLTDADGVVEFETIYPGWYISRTIHIHMKVAVEGTAGETYEGGHVSHTGQLFFDEALTEQVLATEAYAGRPDEERTTNDQDSILADHEDEPGFLVEVAQLVAGSIEEGLLGTIAIGVDSTATPAGVGGGGEGGGAGGPDRGTPPGGG